MCSLLGEIPCIFELGAIGQLAAAIVSGVSTIVTLIIVIVATKELKLNRKNNEFLWEPLFEIDFDVILSLPQTQRLILPRQENERGYSELPESTKGLVDHFHIWRKKYLPDPSADTENTSILLPHPNCNFVILKVTNHQKNLSGQAINITILIEIEYIASEVGVGRIEDSVPIKNLLELRISQINFGSSILICLAKIEAVPKFKIRAKQINYKTWHGSAIKRAKVSTLRFSATGKPVKIIDLIEGTNQANSYPVVQAHPECIYSPEKFRALINENDNSENPE